MKISINVLLFVVASLITIGCDDIIEEDITDQNIQNISPSENAEIHSNAVNFQWTEVEGADDYRVQVFSQGQIMVIDSLVSHSGFTFPLDPGSYQWRVRGENFAYETQYSFPSTFSVVETTDLTNQSVFLSTPSNGFYTNYPTLTFTWQENAVADSYDFELVNVTNSQTVVFTESEISTPSISIDANVINDINAEYQWKVRAINSSSQTVYASRTFKFDSVVPSQPQNSLPLNNDVVSINTVVTFDWTIPSDSGVVHSPLLYIIEFSNDSTFSSIIQAATVSDNTFAYTFTVAADYYWRVKAKDEAGNEGNYSNTSEITVQ